MSIRKQAQELEREESVLTAKINELVAQRRIISEKLEEVYAECNHEWEDYKSHSKEIEGFTLGDPNGGGLVTEVPSRRKIYWTRTCKNCGKTEETSRSVICDRQVPVFKE